MLSNVQSTNRLAKQKRKGSILSKRVKSRVVRYGLLVANISVLAGVSLFVLHSPYAADMQQHSSTVSPERSSGALDQLSSADIATRVASIVRLPEASDVRNYADSISSQLSIVPADAVVVSKPQVVSTQLKSKDDIQNYSTVEGDTVASIAEKQGVSSDSLRWSNDVTGDTLPAGKTLALPPTGTNGIVYTVKTGDTVDSLTEKYKANKELLVSMNDAERGLVAGAKIFIPEGVIIPPVAAKRAAPTASRASRPTSNSSAGDSSSGFAFGNSPIYGRNAYASGFCTWGVANLIDIPANWGNAYTWAAGARASGWNVSTTPTVGAIAQRAGGYGGLGHVGIVTAVNEEGSIKYMDMNGLAGFGRYGETPNFVSSSVFQYYITR